MKLLLQRGSRNNYILAQHKGKYYFFDVRALSYLVSDMPETFLKWGYFFELDPMTKEEEQHLKNLILDRIEQNE